MHALVGMIVIAIVFLNTPAFGDLKDARREQNIERARQDRLNRESSLTALAHEQIEAQKQVGMAQAQAQRGTKVIAQQQVIIQQQMNPSPGRAADEPESPLPRTRGIITSGANRCVLIDGGQMVTSNEVFSVRCNGTVRYWRVDRITKVDAYFTEVDQAGKPLPAPTTDDNLKKRAQEPEMAHPDNK